jgi:hypothetical protein
MPVAAVALLRARCRGTGRMLGPGAVTKPAAKPVASPAADDLPQLLTDAQLEYGANELDLDLDLAITWPV